MIRRIVAKDLSWRLLAQIRTLADWQVAKVDQSIAQNLKNGNPGRYCLGSATARPANRPLDAQIIQQMLSVRLTQAARKSMTKKLVTGATMTNRKIFSPPRRELLSQRW